MRLFPRGIPETRQMASNANGSPNWYPYVTSIAMVHGPQVQVTGWRLVAPPSQLRVNSIAEELQPRFLRCLDFAAS